MAAVVVLRKAFGANCRSSLTSLKSYPSPRLSSPILHRMASTLPGLSIFRALSNHDPASTAVIHSDSGQAFSYGGLLRDVAAARNSMCEVANAPSGTLKGQRIAFLAENSYVYVVTFLAILAHEAIALPLSSSFPPNELRYLLQDSQTRLVLSTAKLAKKALEALEVKLPEAETPALRIIGKQGDSLTSEDAVEVGGESSGHGGLMLYTSGTTSRPKGVLLETNTITAQARSLIEAWRYMRNDLVLHLLPLHHIHGIINGLFTPLLAGSTVEFLFPFNAEATWKRLAAPFLPTSASNPKRPVTFLTAVPTIYNRLLSSHSSLDKDVQEAASKAISPAHLRLNISGSAALPTPTKSAWTKLSQGNILLERYGMTEVGMALSCGLDPADRVDGSVGWPLPSVEARLVEVDTNDVIAEGEELDRRRNRYREGEIQLRGPTIFKEYWRNRSASEADFVQDEDGGGKWFKTGDIAVRRSVTDAEAGNRNRSSSRPWARGPMYFIHGRKSVDIIKSGGEKVSALEVEREMLSLPQIAEVAVVGIPSDVWGQKIAAVIVVVDDPPVPTTTTTTVASITAAIPKKKQGTSALDLRRALRDQLAAYKIPHVVKVVESIPKNAMGKVNKKSLVKELFGDDHDHDHGRN